MRRRQWGAAVYTMCDVPAGSLAVQPVDGVYPTGAPMALLSPTNYLTFGGTGSGDCCTNLNLIPIVTSTMTQPQPQP